MKIRGLIAACVFALAMFATPALAGAAVSVGVTDQGSYWLLTFDGDDAAQDVDVTSTTTSVTFTGGAMDSTTIDEEGMCAGMGPVTCTFTAGDPVLVYASLRGGNDVFDASTASAFEVFAIIEGGAGNDSITGTPWDDDLYGDGGSDFLDGRAGFDYLYLNDGVADQAGSDCGAANDVLTADYFDPFVANCEQRIDVGTPPPPPPPPPSNVFTMGAFAGKALTVTVPGPGFLTAGPATTGSASKKKKKTALIATTKLTVTKAGAHKLPVKLTAAGKRLNKKKTIRAKVKVTYLPNGGTPSSQNTTVVFKKKKKK